MLSRRDLFWITLVVLTWGLHAPIIKLGVEEVGPFLLSFIRFSFTALLFMPFAKRISFDDFIKLIPVALFFVCGNLMFAYLALDNIDSNSFIIIIQLAQPITLICAYFFFKEKFGWLTAIGIGISTSGLLIVFGAPDILAAPLSAAYACLAAISWSLGSLAMKRTGHIKPASFLTYAYLIAMPVALAATFLFEDNHIDRLINADTLNLVFVIIYQVVLMGLMTFVWSGLMARNPAQIVTPFLMIQPIFGVIGSYYLLGETLNPNIYWGGLIVMFGIGIINVRRIIKFKSAT